MHRLYCLASIFLLTLPILIGSTSAPPSKAARNTRQEVAIILLESADDPINPGAPAKAIGAPQADTQLLYSFSRSAEEVVVRDSRRKTSKNLRSLVPALDVESVTIGPNGNVYIADAGMNEVRVMGSGGQVLDAIRVNKPHALGVFRNGDLVVASTEGSNPLALVTAKGSMVRSFGALKSFDRDDRQNRFLNRGRIAVDRSDSIYFVSEFAPFPTVQKFSNEGRLLAEFAIEGSAVDFQAKASLDLLSAKQPGCVGGVRTITAATVDPATSHLWIGMNGTSETAVVYEYDPDGLKLREYAFVLKGSGTNKVITSVKDLVVGDGRIYILNGDGFIYRFNTANTAPVKEQEQQNTRLGSLLVTPFAARPTSPTTNPLKSLSPDLPCPTAQTLSCSANCAQGVSPPTVNCGAEVAARLGSNDRLIGGSCSVPGTSCDGSGTFCNTLTGVTGTITVNLVCPEPSPSPSPVATECTSEQGAECGSMGMITGHPPTCPCVEFHYSDPVVVDVLGDGFNLTSWANGVRFDVDADGTKEHLAWTSPGADDSFLVLDRNGNGTIDDGSELFSDVTPQPISGRPHGFIALAEYDKPERAAMLTV
ncbi:MAG TPA: hypothetical protein VGO68_13250 [Pyrinomonadaceae bacterium]|jgi:hypothetical protein|nr:hypothetical protein [Pyrinomonadaceae bacterium]